MKNNKEILSSLLKTVQMGQVGIRSVLDIGMKADLREVLESQMREYDDIETEAHSLASQRGWELKDLDPAVRFLSDRMTRVRLSGKNVDSKIADLKIQGNTIGVIKSLKYLHQYTGQDVPIRVLTQKLLDCETANIRQMQQFL